MVSVHKIAGDEAMTPITIEFNVTRGGASFREDSVTLRNAEDLFAYVAPGGGCENMPSDIGEIQMIFMPPEHANTSNPLADQRITLQMGMVLMTGPWAELNRISQQILDKVERGELSQSFLQAISSEH
jgi:hypothetical protein